MTATKLIDRFKRTLDGLSQAIVGIALVGMGPASNHNNLLPGAFQNLMVDSASANTLLVRFPDSGIQFLDRCRDRTTTQKDFYQGICSGYIYSKIGRLTANQANTIATNKREFERRHGPTNLDLHTVIQKQLLSSVFEKPRVYSLGISPPLTPEKLLDYTIENLIYRERP